MLNKIRESVIAFFNSKKEYSIITAFAAGLYPFIHYYSSNLSLADSWQQFLFLVVVCFFIPQILLVFRLLTLKFIQIEFLKKYSLVCLNIGVFVSLLIILVFHYNKKVSLILLLISLVIGILLYKHLKKIIIIQFILATLSVFSLIPKLYFAINQSNRDWAQVSESVLNTELKIKPNIFVIQPDGYVNSSEISKLPYNYDNSKFENWLEGNDFVNYSGFRSNYYSTLTSNASMFAMKHHYYSNTNRSTLKTHNAFNVIVGSENNVLNILKNNNYKTHLLTDNSFFLINRNPLSYDYCNVPSNKISYYDTGTVKGVNITSDFKKILDTLPKKGNFFFLEKTIPSHIMYRKSLSKGINQERIEYLNRIELANMWIKELVNNIKKFDEDALVIIVADHGGFVGLEYTLEAVNRRLNPMETISSFSSILSIKWPRDIKFTDLEFKSNVNLFRNVFYSLSNEETLLSNLETNSSYIPLKDNGVANYYECINENGEIVFINVND